MNRREFSIAAAVGLVSPADSRADAVNSRRAAVVVGVDHPTDLPALSGAASSAKRVASWLRAEGFDVHLFVDETSPVRAYQLADTIDALLEPLNLDQLVIFFAGHGCIRGASETWILSGGPRRANESIDMLGSVVRAHDWPVRNIVFISDACRSKAESLAMEEGNGSVLFSTPTAPARILCKVDVLMGSRKGLPAFEVPISAERLSEYQGLFTTTILAAYAHPDADMVRRVDGRDVVPNRSLEGYLLRELPSRGEAISLKTVQQPQCDITSDMDTYIGRARGGALTHLFGQKPEPSIWDVAEWRLESAAKAVGLPHLLKPAEFNSGQYNHAAAATGFDGLVASLTSSSGNYTLSPRSCAIELMGVNSASVRKVDGKLIQCDRFIDKKSCLAIIPLQQDFDEAIVLLGEKSEGGFPAVLLNGYALRIYVQDGIVIHARYASMTRAKDQDMRGSEQGAKWDQLGATIGAAVLQGVFRLRAPTAGQSALTAALKVWIDELQNIDPAAVINIAYASNAMTDNDVGGLFDAALHPAIRQAFPDFSLLAHSGRRRQDRKVSRVPLKTQGWWEGEVSLGSPQVTAQIRATLRQAPWTSVSPKGIELLTKLETTVKVASL
jgi:hypothetical protein